MAKPKHISPARVGGGLMPNRGSNLETQASLRFDIHYAKIGIRARWSILRYRRLARFLGLTPGELASLLHLRHLDLKKAYRTDHFPGPAALLLTLLEAQSYKDYSVNVIPFPFPRYDPPQSP